MLFKLISFFATFLLIINVVFSLFGFSFSPINKEISVQAQSASMYKIPFGKNQRVLITQACIDVLNSANCSHSGYSFKKYAVDFGCRNTDYNIVSIADGVVIENEYDIYGFGYYIKVLHANGTVALYGHLASKSNVSGAVKQGEFLAVCGSTGNSTGPHLHLELRANRQNNRDTIPIYFDECSTQNCFNGQLRAGVTYTSSNTRYKPKSNYSEESIKETKCFEDNKQKATITASGNFIDEVATCLDDKDLLYDLTRSGEEPLFQGAKLTARGDLDFFTTLCNQLINLDLYKIGDVNKTIYNLQRCLIKSGDLRPNLLTGYYGELTKAAIDKYKNKQ